MTTMPAELQAARLCLVKDRPYLASAVWALQPVEKPGLGTLAVDMYWRLYYDPAVITRWNVAELSGVVYHEICHLLRDHASRMKDFDRVAANVATDAEINDDLRAEEVQLPDTPVTPARIGQPNGLLAEEYYAALASEAQQSAPSQGASAQSKRQADDAQPGDRGDATGSQARDSAGSKAGDGDLSESGNASNPASSSSTQPADSPAQPGSSSQPSAGPVSDGRAGGKDGRKPDDGAQTPAPGAGRCGSCATGQPEPWEDGPPSGGSSSGIGIGQAEGELIRRDVAREIKEHTRACGNVPGHWTRWAEEKLRPRVDWRKELAAAVRHAVADVAGASDYSHRRPSRRQGQVGDEKVVLPSLRCPVPSVAVVLDTSGSISDAMLSQALAEVSGILRGLGLREGVHVLACDAQVQTCCRVFRPEQVQLAGGGGTNMGAGLAAAAKLRPMPQVTVVLTDGETPWPGQPPRGMRVIVALTGDGDVPAWAKKIKIDKTGGDTPC